MGERTQAPLRVHGPLTVKYAEACVGCGGGDGDGGDGDGGDGDGDGDDGVLLPIHFCPYSSLTCVLSLR